MTGGLLILVVVTSGVQGFASSATAEPARVRVAGALIDEVVRGLLPLDIVLPATTGGAADAGAPPSPIAMVVTELRYCGATEKGNGRFRAVLHGTSLVGASAAVLGGDDGCRATFADLTRPLSGKAGGREDIALAEIEAVWRPWELRLSIVRLSGPGPARPGEPRPLTALEGRRELLVISTAGLRIVTDAGEIIVVNAAAAFLTDAVDLVATMADGSSGARPSSAGPPPALVGGANVAADIPHSFSNLILRQLTTTRALSVPCDRDLIDVQNVTVSGASGAATVAGLATPRSIGETARFTIQAGGEEARVLAIHAEAQLESCSGLGSLAALGCNTRNAGRNAAASALGAALTQKYQGQAVRDLAGAQTLRFEVGNRRLELQGELLHLASGTRALAVAGRFATGGSSH